MTSAPTFLRSTSEETTSPSGPTDDPREPPRVQLKPKAPATGRVDGGWWPRSRDLATELPGLLEVLAARLGRIERVSYHLGDWSHNPRRISSGDGVVRVGGYRGQHADTVDVLAARQQVTLLVVPPEASAQAGHASLMAAGDRDNTDEVETLLAPARIRDTP